MKKTFVQLFLLLVVTTVFTTAESSVFAKAKKLLKTNSKLLSKGEKTSRVPAAADVKIQTLPLLFEENQGQFGNNIKFLSRVKNFNLALGSDEAVYQMPDPNCETGKQDSIKRSRKPCRAVLLKMKIIGANSDTVIEGFDRSVTVTGYSIGSDQSRWLSDIPNYEGVRYRDIYEGVNLVFRGTQENLEYDFHLAPNADANLIRLKFDGAKNFRINADGELVFKFKGIELKHRKPFAYQIVNGEKTAIEVGYVLLEKNRIGFRLGAYDRAKELIIDPIVYASYLGGTAGGDSINDVAVDPQGNIYTASDARFTVVVDNAAYTYSNIMISKFNPDGNQRLWVRFVGGSQDDVPYGMDVDNSGRVYVTGVTYSPNFPLNFAEQNTHPISRIDLDFTGFVLQLGWNGEVSYSTYLGGSAPSQYGTSIVADENANAYVTGYTCSSNFPTRNGFQNFLQGSCNAFLTKFDNFGHISYSTLFGGTNSIGTDVFTDGSGIAYLSGGTNNGIYTTSGAYSTTGSGFVAKFDTNQTGVNSLVYSTRVSRSAAAIAADRAGNVWVAMSPSGFLTSQLAEVIKLNNLGSALLVGAQIFGNQIRDIAVDANGSAYFSYNFYANNNVASKVTALRPSGEEIDGFTIDAARDERVYGITVGPEPDIVYVGGYTTSLNFPTTLNAYQPTSNAPNIFYGQGFFAKIRLNVPQQRNPLIFIPGVMGSSIRGNWNGLDVPFWVNINPLTSPDLPSVYNLTLDSTSPYYTEGLYASDVVRSALFVPVYTPLLDAFQTMGYKPYDISRHVPPNQGCDLSQKNNDPNLNPSLFVFPYDWRQDNSQTADKLREYVQCVQQFYPTGTKIDVIAHSMGGLVIRRYILQSQTRNEQHGLEKVITIASPLLGAPEAIYKIYTGGDWSIAAIAVSPRNIKFLAPHMSSMHQLFPSRIYHQFNGGIITESGDVNNNTIPDETYSFSQTVSSLDSDFPNTAPGTVGAGFHDFSGQDNWQNDQSGIQYYHIVAEQKQLNTTVGLRISKSVQCRLFGAGIGRSGRCYGNRLFVPQKGFGDKTVPTISASRSMGNTYLGAPNSRLFFHRSPSANKSDEDKAEHTNVTQAQETHQLLTSLLNSEGSSFSIFSPSLNTKFSKKTINSMKNNPEQPASVNETFFIEYDGNNLPPSPDLSNYSPSYYLTITGNMEVIVRDESGNTASIENGLLNNQIDGLNNYEVIGENNIMLTFSTGQTYSIEFLTNDAPIGIDLVKGKGNFQPTLAVRYNDLNIPANSNVKLIISANDSVELKYDANNDGEFETSISPTANVNGEAASDITPPSVNIDIIQQGNRATATITAQDNQSGVNGIWYSLDGQNFQIYSAPVTLQYSPNPIKIEAFADDGVANRSGLVSKEYTFPPIINPIVLITSPSSGSVFPVGTTVNFAGNFSDDQCDNHTADWSFDNLPQAGTVNEISRAVTANYTFTAAGVYLVTLTVNNNCGGTGSANTVDGLTAMVVIYDPNGGFVTGGGWIDSPPGAYTLNSSLTGRASFGFNSKYQRGANVPTGNTEFQFRVADFNFKSTSYDWLVVGGAKAQYKGSGTINNAGSYGFMLTAIDGQISGGGGVDKFRIKIWNKSTGGVIYDNQSGSSDTETPTTGLGGGSIIIHRQ